MFKAVVGGVWKGEENPSFYRLPDLGTPEGRQQLSMCGEGRRGGGRGGDRMTCACDEEWQGVPVKQGDGGGGEREVRGLDGPQSPACVCPLSLSQRQEADKKERAHFQLSSTRCLFILKNCVCTSCV